MTRCILLAHDSLTWRANLSIAFAVFPNTAQKIRLGRITVMEYRLKVTASPPAAVLLEVASSGLACSSNQSRVRVLTRQRTLPS